VRFTPQRPQDELVPGHTAATQTNCRKSIVQEDSFSVIRHFGWAGGRRSAGRQSITTAEPSAWRAKKSGTYDTSLPAIAPERPKRLGRNADHGRVSPPVLPTHE